MATRMSVEWGARAIKQFRAAVIYIKLDSLQNAEKFREKILERVVHYRKFPESGGLDKFKQPNDGSYRYFVKYHYRISYRTNKNGVKIIRIWHEKRKPTKY